MIVNIKGIQYHLTDDFEKSKTNNSWFMLKDQNNPNNEVGFVWNFENNMAPMNGAPRFFGEFNCLIDAYHSYDKRLGLNLENNKQIMYDFLIWQELYYIYQ